MSDTVQNIMTQTLADPVVFKCLECGPVHPNPWLVPKCPNCGGNSWAAPSSMIVNILARSMNRTLPLHRQSAYAQRVVNAQQSASHLRGVAARNTAMSSGVRPSPDCSWTSSRSRSHMRMRSFPGSFRARTSLRTRPVVMGRLAERVARCGRRSRSTCKRRDLCRHRFLSTGYAQVEPRFLSQHDGVGIIVKAGWSSLSPGVKG